MSSTSKQIWCIPPFLFFSRNFSIGLFSPSGSRNSIFVFGNSIKSSFKTTQLNIQDDKNLTGCSVVHNGYEKNFNCTYKREIYLDHLNNKLL